MRRGLMPWRRRPWLERAVRGRLRRPSAPLLGHARCLLRNRADEALRPERPAGVCTEVWGLVPRAHGCAGWGCAGSPASFRNPRDLAWPPPPRCRALRQAPPFLGRAVFDQQWWCDVAACLLAVVMWAQQGPGPPQTPNSEQAPGCGPQKGASTNAPTPPPNPKATKGAPCL